MDIAYWVAEHRQEKCGGSGSFAAEGDRYDQALFPDFDLIEREGLGVARPAEDPAPVEEPADEACLASTLPELLETDKVFGEWMETVVYPTWSEFGASASAMESAACVGEAMGWDEPDLTLERVLPTVDSVVTGWSDLDQDEFSSRAAELDRQLSGVLTDCAKDAYETFSGLLEEQRGSFLERHNETIAAAAQALDEAGYTP